MLNKIDYSHSSKSILEYLYDTHPPKNKRLSRIKNSIIISINLNENKNNKQTKNQKVDNRNKYKGYERDQIIILNNKRVYITKDGYIENL